MNICLVEDDNYKIEDLNSVIVGCFPESTVKIATTYRDAALALKDNWDLVILDMQLPLFTEGTKSKVYALAGERLLRQLERSGKSSPVIVVTQYTTFSELIEEVDFDALVGRLRECCPNVFKAAVQYSYGETAWRIDLEKILKSI